MYQVSEAYKQQIEKTLRNPSHMRITFGIIDPDAVDASTITDNNREYFSDVSKITNDELFIDYSYATLEQNRFLLDNKAILPIEEGYIYQGYVSEAVSGVDGSFEENPMVIIAFNDYFEFAGLTLTFDEYNSDYPSVIKATYLNDGVVVFEKEYNPNASQFVLNDHVPPCNEIRIEFVNTGLPYRRARLTSLIFGIVEVLTNANLVSCKYTEETDIISSVLPKNEFDFTVFDAKRMYDPENPQGVWEYLDKKQEVKFDIGYELDDETIEWMRKGTTLTTGDVSVNRTGVATEVTIKTKTILAHLTGNYDMSVYNAEGITLKQLALNIMKFAGYTEDEIVLDDVLDTITTHVPIEPMAINTALQLVANAGLCLMGANIYGYPIIKRETTDSSDFNMSFSKMLETPKTTKYPVVRNLITQYVQVSVSDTADTVVSETEITEANSTNIEFTHDAITEHSVTVGNGLTLNGSAFYAHKTVLNLTGTGKISITGKRINQSIVKYTKHCNDVGEDLEISNPLISTYEDCKAFAEWIASAMARRIEYEVSDRGYPELDVGDQISFETNGRNVVGVTSLKRVTSFSGAIRGEGKYLIRGGDG